MEFINLNIKSKVNKNKSPGCKEAGTLITLISFKTPTNHAQI
jgi:hypothetical protein